VRPLLEIHRTNNKKLVASIIEKEHEGVTEFLTFTVLLAVISLLSSSEAFPNTTFLSLNICIKSTIVSAASVASMEFDFKLED
jgi:hypothetical protein